ncbi:MAG: AMP-binding protein [Hyphomicrobiaceae bacterium]|nr:AMP-binding protein [Hyphomicrobiaceae bacterium]
MQKADREALRRTTAPALLCAHACAKPDRTAFRAKVKGIYRARTWAQYAKLVAAAAKALEGLGLAKGDRIAIMGDPCEEWLILDMAAQALGAIVYGIYPTASAAEVAYQMRDGGAKIFVAEDQEYLDKALGVIGELPGLASIVVVDEAALFAYDNPLIRCYRDLVGAARDADLAWLSARVQQVAPSDPAFIVYTSGTTGNPKGALIAHGTHLASTATVSDHYPLLYAQEQRTVVYLPLCHVLGRDVAVTLPLISSLVPHFGEDPEDLATSFFETAPTVLFTVPRYLQKFASQVLIGTANASPAKRAAYAAAMRLARPALPRRWSGHDTVADRVVRAASRALMFRPILNKLGLDQLQLVVSGGAPLPAETMALWQMWGVNVVEMYGQTETAGGILAGQRGPFPRPGSVGTPPEGWDVRLGDDGEILLHKGDIFDGYWNAPEATAAVFTADGALRTGDVGAWHDGALKLIDRARDFLVTSGGKTISPSYVENALRASPYVSEVAVFGHGRKYLTALIEIDMDTVADWARAHDVAYTGFTNLAENPRVVALLGQEIERANRQLARVEQIKAYRILPKQLDPEEEGEPVTPTRKVKRKQMYERFKALVDAMYDDQEERLLSAGAGGVTAAP